MTRAILLLAVLGCSRTAPVDGGKFLFNCDGCTVYVDGGTSFFNCDGCTIYVDGGVCR